MPLVTLIVLGDWRRKRLWLAVLFPSFFYFAFLFFSGGIRDAALQLGAFSERFISQNTEAHRLQPAVVLGFLFGYLCMLVSIRYARTFGTLVLFGILFNFAIALKQGLQIMGAPALALFGTSLGAVGYLAGRTATYWRAVQAGVLVLCTAWSVSLSIGYHSPVLAAGPLAVLLIGYCHLLAQAAPISDKNRAFQSMLLFLIIGLSIVAALSYKVGRQKYVYEDRSANELTASLEGILPGLRGIRTNINTREFLVDLRDTVNQFEKHEVFIIPGVAAYWVRSTRINPALNDWLADVAWTHRPALINRCIQNLETHHGTSVILLQKYKAGYLAKGFIPYGADPTLDYVRTHFKKMGETKFFELYE